MPTHTLVLETAYTAMCGIVVNGQVLRETTLDATRRHHRDLVPAIHGLLNELQLKPSDLAHIMVGIGPGSYTGLRVGIAVAKTMAYTLDIPLVAVPTFSTIANRTPTHIPRVDVIGDALQGTAYRQAFGPADALGNRTALDTLRIETWAAPATGTMFTGPGVETFKLTQDIVEPEFRLPSVEATYRTGRTLPPLDTPALYALEPFYLRGSSAEEKARKTAAKP